MRKLILVLGILAISLTAYASPVNMTFVAFQPGGWQVGYPYYVTANGTLANMMCDDWAHGGLPGDIWQANFTNLGTGDLSLLRFNQMNGALTLYQEAGWLLLEAAQSPVFSSYINYAVWHIFDSSAPLSRISLYWLDQAQLEAQNGFPGVNFNSVGIYTPVNQYDTNPVDAQEFLTIVPQQRTVTPEPGTLILLCSALAGVVAYKRPR